MIINSLFSSKCRESYLHAFVPIFLKYKQTPLCQKGSLQFCSVQQGLNVIFLPAEFGLLGMGCEILCLLCRAANRIF